MQRGREDEFCGLIFKRMTDIEVGLADDGDKREFD